MGKPYKLRLVDHIRAKGYRCPGTETRDSLSFMRAALHGLISSGTVIFADSVMEELNEQAKASSSGYVLEFDKKDIYPSPVPPMEQLFWEADNPEAVFYDTGSGLPKQYGFAAFTHDMKNMESADCATLTASVQDSLLHAGGAGSDYIEWSRKVARWVVVVIPFWRQGKKPYSVPASIFYLVDELGKWRGKFFVNDRQGVVRNSVSDISDFTIQVLPFVKTMSMLNCKNVGLTGGERAPKAMVDARKRTGAYPPVEYKVLKVTTIGGKPVGNRGTGRSIDKREHVCRGHFSVYDEKPLFGKYRGVFWIPQHLRGKRAKGKIIKDYEV